jgi:hypothetical protein
MADRAFWLGALSLGCLGVYLFVSAPPPLDERPLSAADIPVAETFAALEAQNDAVRALWTQEIVGAGTQVGLKFHEHWRDRDLEAGPLPALFLRETAKSPERNPVQLSLFLGSDFPINDSNRFEGLQLERFQVLRRTGEPQFFYMPDTRLHTGMFSDVAVAEPCVRCHNEHEQSEKNDWRLNDVMGATTWVYPAAAVSIEEFLEAVAALHHGFEDAYLAYIRKVETFANPPAVGERWPREGYFVPSPAVFMQEVRRRTAPDTLAVLAGLAGGRNRDGRRETPAPPLADTRP